MAYFRLRVDAKNWFAGIADSPFKTQFDIWYLCALAGLANGAAIELSATTPASDMVERPVEEYRPVSRLLIGLLIVAEMRQEGIDIYEGAPVRALMKKIIDPESPNSLTEHGMKRLNGYSSGGYELLAESRDQRPVLASEFLETYVRFIRNLARPDGAPV